jgi:hypothetical protein
MSHFTTGKALKPEDVKICVLYDPKDGRIAHHHMVGTFPGGQRVDKKEVERRTLARAASFGTDTSKLKALHVSEKDCNPSHRYKVDIKTLALIELPKPERLGFKGSSFKVGSSYHKRPKKRGRGALAKT